MTTVNSKSVIQIEYLIYFTKNYTSVEKNNSILTFIYIYNIHIYYIYPSMINCLKNTKRKWQSHVIKTK